MTVFAGLVKLADSDPASVAIEGGDDNWTRGDLLAASTGVAALLLRDTPPGRTVALVAGCAPRFIAGFVGIVMAGDIAAVMDPAWADARLEETLAELEASAVLAGRGDEARLKGALSLDRAVERGLEDRVALLHPPAVDVAAPFYLGFTSGTSGRPKAFRRSHASWRASFEAGRRAFGLRAGDTVLVPGPLTHSLFLYAALDGLDMGASIVMPGRFDARRLVARLSEGPIDRIWLVPTMAVALAEAAARASAGPFGQVATVLFGGARLDGAVEAATAKLFPNAEIVEFYGASELSFVAWRSSRDPAPAGAVGRPFDEVEVEVRDEQGTVLGTGSTGTVFVRSPFLSQGYVIGGDGMGFRRDLQGWATVGDRGRLDEAGFLHLDGREGEMIVTGGRNVYPAEIEDALVAAMPLDGVMVTGLPDPRWGTAVAAILKPKGAPPCSLAEIATALEGRIEAWKRPKRAFIADDLPLTSTGKIARGRLRSWLDTDEAKAAELR